MMSNWHDFDDSDDAERDEWEAALDKCVEILRLCDRVPSRGEDFACSVRESVEDMQVWIEEKQSVTDGQLRALGNWERGLRKWVR